MTTLNISLPDTLKRAVTKRVKSGNFGNTSDYIRHLIRKDEQLARAKTEFREFIQPGLDDIKAGRVFSLEEAFADIEESLKKAV